MTTPADWRAVLTQLKDVESVRFVERLVQFQQQWLDSQAAQLEEIRKELQEHSQRLGGQQ